MLFPASGRGRDLSGAVACDLNTGVAADVLDLALRDGRLLATRPIYSGNIMVDVVSKADPQIASVRNRAFPAPEANPGLVGKVVKVAPVLAEGQAGTSVNSFEVVGGGEISLGDARIIVSGGRGVKGAEGFAPIKALADDLGAALGASSTSRWAFPAPSSTWPAWGRPRSSWRSTRMPKRPSLALPTTASSATCSRSCRH